MWNLPLRAPLAHNDPTAFSLAEDLRQRAYELQALGGRFDDVLLRAVSADYLDAHVLRVMLDELARATTLEWGRAWVPLTATRFAALCMCPERTARVSVERLIARDLIDRRRRGVAGGGVRVEFAVDPVKLSGLLDVATWRYLFECFPDAPRPELPIEVLAALAVELKCDIAALSRTAAHCRSSLANFSGSDSEADFLT